MAQLAKHYGLILAVAGAVLFLNLGGTRLWDRDEPRNAGCTAEMLARNDLVVPYFDGLLRAHKPVLLYWFMMTAYAVFGQNEFAARFWSATFGLGTVLCTYHIARRLFNAEIGLWGALILSTSLMFDVAARAATPDATLIFFSTAALLVFVLATFPSQEPDETAAEGSAVENAPQPYHELLGPDELFPSLWPAATLYALLGLAVLAKGPVGVILPMAVIGLFLLILRMPAEEIAATEPEVEAPKKRKKAKTAEEEAAETDSSLAPWREWLGQTWKSGVRAASVFAPLHFLRTLWLMQPLTAILVVLAVAAPWYVWVGLRTEGEWLTGFFIEHNLRRATESFENHTGEIAFLPGIIFYPVAILAGFFPWSCFLLPIGLAAWQRIADRDRHHAGYVLACCWIAVYLGAFSLAGTKLPNYVTPCYPALAMLAGAFVYHWVRNDEFAESWWPRIALGCCAVVGVVLLVVLPVVAAKFLPGEEMLAGLGMIPLLGAVIAFVWLEHHRMWETAVTFTVTGALFAMVLFGYVAVRVDQHQEFGDLVAKVQQCSRAPRLASFGRLESSWVYYSGRPIHEFAKNEPREVGDFLLKDRDGFLITTEEDLEKIRGSNLPRDTVVLAKCRYFLHKGNLVLLGRPTADQTATQFGGAKR